VKYLALPTSAVILALLAACSGANTAGAVGTGESRGEGGAGGAGGGELGGSLPGGQGGSDETTIAVTVGTSSTGSGTGVVCDVEDDEDRDGDGITKAGGDCNDCDANVNPNAIEVVITEPDETGVIPEPADEDCDEQIDNLPAQSCDEGIVLESANASDGARSIELCQGAPEQGGWGVISSGYVRGDGTPVSSSLQFGIQSAFGPNVVPQAGGSMLNLSSGHARLPGQPGECDGCGCETNADGATPDGSQFPQTSPQCPGGGPGTEVYDDIAYEVRLRAPSNATGFAFDFFFYTFEYEEFVCSFLGVNDQFIAWMQPPPAAAPNGNISFDATGNPISVNAAFFNVCNGCAMGPAQLQGTGFDTWGCNEAGGTGWLTTQAPVTGGQEFSIRFAIWDSGDGVYDSSVLVDNFRWIANGGTVAVGTTPSQPPN
jgi:hypothetical protein